MKLSNINRASDVMAAALAISCGCAHTSSYKVYDIANRPPGQAMKMGGT